MARECPNMRYPESKQPQGFSSVHYTFSGLFIAAPLKPSSGTPHNLERVAFPFSFKNVSLAVFHPRSQVAKLIRFAATISYNNDFKYRHRRFSYFE